MRLHISSELIERMRAHAAAFPDREVCGLLLGREGEVSEILPADNVADDTARRFEIDPAVLIGAYRAAREGGPDVIGCYHSHPGGTAEPSAVDAANALPNSIWIIIGARGMAAWHYSEGGFVAVRFIPQF